MMTIYSILWADTVGHWVRRIAQRDWLFTKSTCLSYVGICENVTHNISAGWEDVTQSYFRSIKHLSNLKHKQHFFKVFNDSGRLLWYKIMPTYFQWICLHWHMPRRCTNCIMPRCPAVFSDSNELNHCLQYQPIISYTSLAFVVLTKPYCAPLNISLLKRTDSKKMSYWSKRMKITLHCRINISQNISRMTKL